MTPKQIADTVKDILSAVEADLLDPTTGKFKVQPDYADDAQAIQDVETAYVAHGGTLSPNVKTAIAGVVAVLRIV